MVSHDSGFDAETERQLAIRRRRLGQQQGQSDPLHPLGQRQHVDLQGAREEDLRIAVGSVYLRRILDAQEEGARRFMGTYFGDGMYGPFPRAWWKLLCRVGVLYKVEWDRVGFETHAALLMHLLSHTELGSNGDGRRLGDDGLGGDGLGLEGFSQAWEPRSAFSALQQQQQQQQEEESEL